VWIALDWLHSYPLKLLGGCRYRKLSAPVYGKSLATQLAGDPVYLQQVAPSATSMQETAGERSEERERGPHYFLVTKKCYNSQTKKLN
jgi:hypothetical protein